jgi:hypothetical protein
MTGPTGDVSDGAQVSPVDVGPVETALEDGAGPEP